MKVAIRTDSSTLIGTGHVMRCLTLAVQLKKMGADVHFISRELEGNILYLIEKRGFKLHRLKSPSVSSDLHGYAAWLAVLWEEDANDTADILNMIAPVDWLVVDHYAIDSSWEERLKLYVKRIFVVDDLANRNHVCDALFDPNDYSCPEMRYAGLVPDFCRMFFGLDYVLLREEFYDCQRRKRDGCIRRLLVFYGGSDATNETEKVVRVLSSLNKEIEADIIVGESNKRKEEIAKQCMNHRNFHFHCQIDNMSYFMNRADAMLGAGGGTTWERVYLGLPAIVTCVADNQLQSSQCGAKRGWQLFIGEAERVTEEDIRRVVIELINHPEICLRMQRCALKAVQSHRPYGVAKYMTEMVEV